MGDTPGKRLYLIRLACGDGVRTPETLKVFSDRIREATGVLYHPNALSLLERDEQNWRIEDARLLAQVDPQGRGAVWLSALAEAASIETLDPTKDRKLTMQEIQRARLQVAREEAEAARQPKPAAVKKRRKGTA